MLKLIAVAGFALTIATSAQGMTPAPLARAGRYGDTSGGRMRSGQDQNQRCMRSADDRAPDSPRRPQMRAMAGRRLRPISVAGSDAVKDRHGVGIGTISNGLCESCSAGAAGFARATFRQPTGLRSVSLLQADCPERVLKPAGLGILNQRKPGCLAALCTGKFLGRYGGAILRPRRASRRRSGHSSQQPPWS